MLVLDRRTSSDKRSGIRQAPAHRKNETLKSSGLMPTNFFCEVRGKVSNGRNSRVGQMVQRRMAKIYRQPFRLLVHKRNLKGKSKRTQAVRVKLESSLEQHQQLSYMIVSSLLWRCREQEKSQVFDSSKLGDHHSKCGKNGLRPVTLLLQFQKVKFILLF